MVNLALIVHTKFDVLGISILSYSTNFFYFEFWDCSDSVIFSPHINTVNMFSPLVSSNSSIIHRYYIDELVGVYEFYRTDIKIGIYIYMNLQFLNHVIIIKTQVLLPRA